MKHSDNAVELLRAELAELRREVASLQLRETSRTTTEPRLAVTQADADVRDPEVRDADDTPPSNRRNFLRLAGAAAVGGAAVAVATSAQPAAANIVTGEAVQLGISNRASLANETTRLINPSGTELDDQTFAVQNYTPNGAAPVFPATHRIAIAASTSGPTTGDPVFRTSVYARTSSPAGAGGQGVFGSSDGPDNSLASAFKFGVVGTAPDAGFAVFGLGEATGTAAVGVLGRADAGFGVVAASTTGVSLFVRDGGRLQQTLRPTPGPPPTGNFSIGEQVRDSLGDLYICTASGNPGTWRKVAAQHPAYTNAGGSINLLPRPIRILDSRGNGAPVTNGSAKFDPGVPLDLQVTGTVADSLAVPAGAKGVLGNLTATESNGNGFALVWPADQPQPATSNINYSSTTGNPAIANYFVSALDATGKIKVQCAVSGTHLLVDIFGFVY